MVHSGEGAAMTYVLEGHKWGAAATGSGAVVTWSFADYNLDAQLAQTYSDYPSFQHAIAQSARDTIRSAFAVWDAAADIDFVEIADSVSSNIRVGQSYLDGPAAPGGTTLYGYANYWWSNGVYSTATVTFDNDAFDSIQSLYWTAVHEIGHTIGFSHSDATTDVMYPLLNAQNRSGALSASEQAGVQALYGSEGVTLVGGATAESFVGTASLDAILGGAGNDVITGLAGNDWLFGQEGDDVVYAGADVDHVYGGDGNDWLFGEAGDDGVLGEAGNDCIDGGAGSDWLYGQDGADTIVGGAGIDFITGGAGNDQLTGGSGTDVFLFSGLAEGVDRITDFVTNGAEADIVVLSGYGLNSFADIQARMAQVGADVVLNASPSTAILFQSHRTTDFLAGNFAF